jgi:uncharacterized Zn finger protein
MALLHGEEGKCPKCGHHHFVAPNPAGPEDKVRCEACGHVTTVKEARDAGRARPQAGGSENLVDK